jgi:hypothetical protein
LGTKSGKGSRAEGGAAEELTAVEGFHETSF